MREFVTALLRRDTGATAIEYSLIAGCIALLIIGILGVIGTDVVGMFQGLEFTP